MLTVKYGNLFSAAKKDCIIMHGCNAMGVMGSGFALQIKRLYPEAYQLYRESPRTLGSVSYAFLGNTFVIANAVTQKSYGREDIRYVSYDATEECCRAVAKVARDLKLPVHLPFIGAGYGGGDAEILKSIFDACFKTVEATLWVYPEEVGNDGRKS